MEQEHQTEYLLRTVASELRDVTRLFALPAELWEEETSAPFLLACVGGGQCVSL